MKRQQGIENWSMATGRIAAIAIVLALMLGFGASGSLGQTENKNDGSQLLDSCSEVVKTLDDSNHQIDHDKFYWCMGFIDGVHAFIEVQRTIASTSFEEYKTKAVFGILIPDGVTKGQMARVIVKWLQDHPQRLHEDRDMLALVSLREAFPAHVETVTRNVQ
jgi:hypothetical protein